MPFSGGDRYYCRKFQSNVFDPSRCGSCLRPGHMHLNTTGPTPQDDCDVLSVVVTPSSDVIRGGWACQESLVHSLSPEWELNICDSDTLYSSPDQWCSWSEGRGLSSPEGGASSSPEGRGPARPDMTRRDPSPRRTGDDGYRMEENRGRSRRPSESRGDRERESGYFSPDRKGENDGAPREDGPPKRPYRHYERGRPLPSNHSPEPKACVPFRNQNLGTPSQRRNSATYNQESWRSESPQRYVYRSNFRRDASRGRGGAEDEEERRSPSPERYGVAAESPALSSSQRHRRGSSSHHSRSRAPSHAASRQPSGRSSPSRGLRGSAAATAAPPRNASSSRRRGDSRRERDDDDDERFQRGGGRESRRPSRTANGHGLDSEKLYRNLDSVSRRGSSSVRPNEPGEGSRSPRHRTDTNGSDTGARARNSRECSPPRGGYGTKHRSPQRETPSARDNRPDTTQSYSNRAAAAGYGGADADASPPAAPGSWRGSSRSLLSPAPSLSSPLDSRLLARTLTTHVAAATVETTDGKNGGGGNRSRSGQRRGLEALLTSEPKRSNAVETEDTGMTIDDYVIIADIPRLVMESEEDAPGLRRRTQSPSPRRDERHREARSREETGGYSARTESDERGRGRERGRREREREKCRDSEDGVWESTTYQPHTKGWMSRLDENGKWRKHWFVVGDSVLRYFRDSEAEESDEPDGEIDLTSCLSVQDCDVEKNYGFQIQTKRTVFTLSATTSRIRKNWVKVLRQAIQDNYSPNIARQSGSGNGKENPLARPPSSCQPPSRLTCEVQNAKSAGAATRRQTDRQSDPADRDPDVVAPAGLTSQREAGEGWDREQAKRLEERNKWFEAGIPFSEMASRWDSMELKKGRVPIPVSQMDPEVIKKWAELERLSFRDTSALIGAETSPSTRDTNALIGAEASPSTTAKALQREASSLREQVEGLRRERVTMGVAVEADGPGCGPGSPCGARLEAMEQAHRRTLRETQERHARELRGLERERDRALEEEGRSAAQAVEALKKAHKEELEREVEKARRLGGGDSHMDSTYTGQQSPAHFLHGELDVLSERYSQTCLELSRAEQSGGERESDPGRTEREMTRLRRENQELKARLAEEISRMRHFITGQSSDFVTPGNSERSPSELEMLLRAKENEIQYLQKEIVCLQNEVQSLTKEKERAYDQYKEAYVELSGMKGRSQLEMGSLREHLRLANAALQEGTRDS